MDTTFSHIKAVFCDIDGTLLTSQHTVSPRTVAAIRALRERGVLFGLCTGRDAHATEAMYELWGIEGLVDVLVGCGGAEVIDRAHDINELSYPAAGRDHRAHLRAHGRTCRQRPFALGTAYSMCPRAMHASSTCRVSTACPTRWSTLPSFYASRRPR